MVDIGAGSGQFALAAARRFGSDRAGRLAGHADGAARARGGRRAGQPGVRPGGFLSYSTPGRPPTACTPGNALHQLPDFWKGIALDRIARMLRPGGVLRLRDLIYDFRPAEAEESCGLVRAGRRRTPRSGYTGEDYAPTHPPPLQDLPLAARANAQHGPASRSSPWVRAPAPTAPTHVRQEARPDNARAVSSYSVGAPGRGSPAPAPAQPAGVREEIP